MVKHRTATVLIVEIGVDMTRFPTAAHLASWAKFAGINLAVGGGRPVAVTIRAHPRGNHRARMDTAAEDRSAIVGTVVDAAESQRVQAPSIVVVGEVAALHEQFGDAARLSQAAGLIAD